jgi:hypothetical protein
VAQVLGGIAAAGVLYLIASGHAGFDVAAGFAANGYADHSPGGYTLGACLVAELVMTFMFLIIILGATDKRAPAGFAPIAIGLGLTLIHLISIPVTNTSVNPARSTGPALFVGGWALAQLWLFWVAPIAGAALAGLAYRAISAEPRSWRQAPPRSRDGTRPQRAGCSKLPSERLAPWGVDPDPQVRSPKGPHEMTRMRSARQKPPSVHFARRSPSTGCSAPRVMRSDWPARSAREPRRGPPQ